MVVMVLLLSLSGAAPALAMALENDDSCCPGEEGDDDDDDGCCFACVDCAHKLAARPMLPAADWLLSPPRAITGPRDPLPPAPITRAASGVDDDVFHPPRR